MEVIFIDISLFNCELHKKYLEITENRDYNGASVAELFLL